MYTTTRGSPIRRLDNSEYNLLNSPEIRNVEHINSTIMDYINPKRHKNKIDLYDENSSLVRNIFLQNQIYNSYYSNSPSNMKQKTYQRPLKVNIKRNQFEENKSSIYLPNDGAFTRLIGEVSSSSFVRNDNQNKTQRRNKLSKYLMKNKDIIKKQKNNSLNDQVSDEEVYSTKTFFNKQKHVMKSKSTHVSADLDKRKESHKEENEVPEIKTISINLSKGGVVNLNLNQIKRKYAEKNFNKEEDKIIFLQNFIRDFIQNKKIYDSDYYIKVESFTNKIYNLFLKEKRYFVNKLILLNRFSQMKLIKRHLNYHKPIVKQKRENDSAISLNHISNFFLPTQSSNESYKTLKDNLYRNHFEVYTPINEFELENKNEQNGFKILEYSEPNSLFFKAIKPKISENEIYEEKKYKKLYEKSEQELNKLRSKSKDFGYLYIRKKVNNLHFNPSKKSSFNKIEMDFPEDGDFMYEAIKKKLAMKKLVNNIQIKGIKKNPYLWVQLPFAIKNLLQKYINKQNCRLFFNNLKSISLMDKQEEKLMKNFEREDMKIKRKYFNKLNYKVLKINDDEKLGKEKLNNLVISNEVNFEIERDIYNASFLSDSFCDMDNKIINNNKNSTNNSFEKKRKGIKNYKLESIPKPRKIYFFRNKALSASRSANRIKKKLERSERIRNRALHFIDRKNDSHSQRKYKKIKIVKKVYDNITGNIHEINIKPKNDDISINDIDNNKEEKCFGEMLLHEDKNSKMKRLVKHNKLSHFFKFWKSITKIKVSKPRFYDIIVIMMKCLFTNNLYIKAAFMGEIYFIKGKYLFIWFRNSLRQKKKFLKKLIHSRSNFN